MRYALICSPGGSGLKSAVEQRLAAFVQDTGQAFNHRDVEDELCSSYEVRKALQGLPVPNQPKVGDITRFLGRSQVIRFWKDSLRQSLTSLIHADDRAHGDALNVLTCHLDLYGGRRRELYSAIDIQAFVEDGHEVSHVLLLIDDIYDMYTRLSQPSLLYDEGAGLPEYIRMQEEASDAALPQADLTLSRQPQAEWTLEYKTNVLSALLAWRRAEMLMAEAVAHQLGAKYMVYAVKQSTSAVAHWLNQSSRNAVYISHPITRPRETRRLTGTWPGDRVVEGCNELQAQLDAHGVTCVMPTGIDEFRLVVSDGRTVPRLDTRWPIASTESDFSDTMYVTSVPDQPELGDVLLAADFQDDSRDWRPWLRSLENQIMTEVAFRDHHLVAANPGLLVFRPYYGTGESSHGVAAEVDHWRTLTEDPTQTQRRAAFVHFSEDVGAMLRVAMTLEAANLGYQTTAATAATLEQRGFSRRGMAQALIHSMATGSSLDSLLDAGLIPVDLHSKLRTEWQSITGEAEIRVLRELLTLIEMPEDRAGIWVVDSEAKLRTVYRDIARFLQGESLPSLDWTAGASETLRRIRTDLANEKPN